jgi:hypothetical protein
VPIDQTVMVERKIVNENRMFSKSMIKCFEFSLCENVEINYRNIESIFIIFAPSIIFRISISIYSLEFLADTGTIDYMHYVASGPILLKLKDFLSSALEVDIFNKYNQL